MVLYLRLIVLVPGIILISFQSVIAQKSLELGVSIGSVNNSNSKTSYEFLDISSETIRDYKLRSTNVGLFVRVMNNEVSFFELGVNYEQGSAKTQNQYDYFDGSQRLSEGKSEFNGFGIHGGIGKRYSKNKLLLQVGAEIPFTYRSKTSYSTSDIDINATGIQTEKRESYKTPQEYTVGSNIVVGLNYNIWKSLFLGLNIRNGIAYQFSDGSFEVINEFYDNSGKLLSSLVETNKIDNSQFNTSFLNTSLIVFFKF